MVFKYLGKVSLMVALIQTVILFLEGHKHPNFWYGLFSGPKFDALAGNIFIFLFITLVFAFLGDIYEKTD